MSSESAASEPNGPFHQPVAAGQAAPDDEHAQPSGTSRASFSSHDPSLALLLAELREIGSIDLESVAVDAVFRVRRPVLDAVETVERERDTVVVVTLSHGGQHVVGRARTGHASGQVDRASAEATLLALDLLVPPGRVEWYVDRAELLGPPTPNRPAIVNVTVEVRTGHGPELLAGSALVRTTSHEAAARATLDALNRRLDQLT